MSVNSKATTDQSQDTKPVVAFGSGGNALIVWQSNLPNIGTFIKLGDGLELDLLFTMSSDNGTPGIFFCSFEHWRGAGGMAGSTEMCIYALLGVTWSDVWYLNNDALTDDADDAIGDVAFGNGLFFVVWTNTPKNGTSGSYRKKNSQKH